MGQVHISDRTVKDKVYVIYSVCRKDENLLLAPIVNTIEQVVSGAVDKLKVALETILGRLQNH